MSMIEENTTRMAGKRTPASVHGGSAAVQNSVTDRIRDSVGKRLALARYFLHAVRAERPQGYGIATREQLSEEGYLSQYGQDRWVATRLFEGKRQGVFVDIGAHDGVTLSNTCYLERELGWSGLAIEPSPQRFEQLRQNRSCTCVNACVGARDEVVTFRLISGYAEMLSGRIDQYHPDHVKRIEGELLQRGGSFEDIDVPAYSINRLFEQHGLRDIDYLSIDVEGSELDILSALDFDRFNIKVVGVENNYKDYRLPELMKRNNFTFHSIVGDEFYVKGNLL